MWATIKSTVIEQHLDMNERTNNLTEYLYGCYKWLIAKFVFNVLNYNFCTVTCNMKLLYYVELLHTQVFAVDIMTSFSLPVKVIWTSGCTRRGPIKCWVWRSQELHWTHSQCWVWRSRELHCEALFNILNYKLCKQVMLTSAKLKFTNLTINQWYQSDSDSLQVVKIIAATNNQQYLIWTLYWVSEGVHCITCKW